ncbi:hypothetical protein GCM10023321_69930 [Pseudonocardia eucalypti]|uniref:HTH cro/C1-type domain-containing protein n=1 Tax=Pseudonocardia eucalypti TaxID=648755 RepID=A0ABP9R3U6_9PSEU|nr:transcriptional regulator with XRE-family HTH domain [Pseudonocardia eucalypti]
MGGAAGAELRRLREERGLSLADLSKLVHYSKGYLSKLENGGKPITPDIAARFDRALDAGERLRELVAPDPVCPYPGLASFDGQTARWFFGRDRDTQELLDALARRPAGAGPLFVVGASGAGKSSLLRAGLIPAIADGRLPAASAQAPLLLTPGSDPMRALEAAGERRVVVVDQFEEIFTLCKDAAAREAFIRALGALPGFVVLGLRADFYPNCMDHPELVASLRGGHLPLGPMTEAELRDAIARPARAVGLEVEPGLTEIMLRDLGLAAESAGDRQRHATTLPLLSHALRATWAERTEDRLTHAGYARTGGIAGCIAATADEAITDLDDDARPVARALLPRLVETGESPDKDARRRVPRDRLLAGLAGTDADTDTDTDTAELVLNTLVHARLVTTGADSVELIHECLVRSWPWLRRSVDADRAGLRVEQRLAEAAAAWHREGRHQASLYRGPRLAAAVERTASSAARPDAVAQDFLRESTRAEQAEQRAVVTRTRRLRALVAALAVLVALIAVVALDTVGQRNAARSREVAAAANWQRVPDPTLAGHLALAALDLHDTPEARGAVLAAGPALDSRHRINSDSTDTVHMVAADRDGTLLAAAGQDHTVRVWRRVPGRELDLAGPAAYLEHPTQVLSAMFDPRGRWLVSSGADDRLRFWSTAGLGTIRDPLFDHPGHGGPLAFSPDGALLATLGATEATIRLWDLTGPEPRPIGPDLDPRYDDVLALAFTPDGRTLVSGTADGTVSFWDLADPAAPRAQHRPLAIGRKPVQAIAISPDGRTMAAGQGDATVTLWRIGNPSAIRELSDFPGPVNDVRFSGDLLAVASDDTLALWDVADPAAPEPLARPINGDGGTIWSVAALPGALVTAGQDGTVQAFDTDPDRAAERICALARYRVTPDQWERYLPDRDYRPRCAEPAGPPAPDEGPTAERGTQLRAKHSNKCVAVKDGAEAAPALQQTCARQPGMTWSLLPDGDGYRIRNEASGLCLTSASGERRAGGAEMVVQRPCDAPDGGRWHIHELNRGVSSADVIITRAAPVPECLDVNHASQDDGAHLIRWPCAPPQSANEIFRVSAGALDQ